MWLCPSYPTTTVFNLFVLQVDREGHKLQIHRLRYRLDALIEGQPDRLTARLESATGQGIK